MISAQFAQLLMAGRAEFNRRVAEARRRHQGFDTDAFSAFLSSAADAVVCAVSERAPDRAGAAAVAVYDLALELAAHGHTGVLVRRVWSELAPCYAGLLGERPSAVLGMLTNAALHLQKRQGVRVEEWLDLMQQLAPQATDLQQLGAVGQICAWRAGMAHYRAGAIAAADNLPATLALAAFGANGGTHWSALREVLLRDPWWTPNEAARQRLAAGIEIGSFAGFGGEFSEPPEVRPADLGFWVCSGERYFLLMADACGAILHPATEDEYAHPQPPATASHISISGQRLTLNGRLVELDLPGAQVKVVCNASAAAIVSPFSHAIRVLPLR
ncbi:hypothetical protein GTP58_02575 [Duganella sp. CY15W]|uniref:hypothetical protein n=1 Tax=Duganella sp. CY15W TaxID=2692172 RepID=UPI00136D6CCE|nr:hypothetical protein [Duganella sp. CY15W]MYM27204.1 hypothetical protein [Duganella sp. CY15W]